VPFFDYLGFGIMDKKEAAALLSTVHGMVGELILSLAWLFSRSLPLSIKADLCLDLWSCRFLLVSGYLP